MENKQKLIVNFNKNTVWFLGLIIDKKRGY